MKKIVSNSLEDGVKPKVVYNSAKLNQYFNVKDPVIIIISIYFCHKKFIKEGYKL